MKKVLLVAIGSILLLLAAFAGFIGYMHATAPTFEGVASIADEPAYQDPALLAVAWELPAASTFAGRLKSQSNGSRCGPATLANTLASIGSEDDTEEEVLDDTGLCWTGMCFGGITLDELADIARVKGVSDVAVFRDITYEEFRQHLIASNDAATRYTINFQRGPLFGKSSGHHSPIGGYLDDEDLVFVLDTNDDYRPWLVNSRRLFEAMNTLDSTAGATRGLMRIRVTDHGQ